MENKDVQLNLFGSSITSIPTSLPTPEWVTKIPENGWNLLRCFFYSRQPQAQNYPMSVALTDLKRMVKDKMCMNTVRAMVDRLKENSYIKLVSTNTGKTRSANRFLITLDGAYAFKRYENWKNGENEIYTESPKYLNSSDNYDYDDDERLAKKRT